MRNGRRSWTRLAFIAATLSAGTLIPHIAAACVPAQHPRADQLIARDAYRSAQVAVVDAEIVAVGGSDWGSWVMLKSLKVWKGPQQATFKVTYQTSCDIGSDVFQVGRRYRLLLRNEGDGYRVDAGDNGLLGRNLDAFNLEIDRLVGTPRPADFETCACYLPPPRP